MLFVADWFLAFIFSLMDADQSCRWFGRTAVILCSSLQHDAELLLYNMEIATPTPTVVLHSQQQHVEGTHHSYSFVSINPKHSIPSWC